MTQTAVPLDLEYIGTDKETAGTYRQTYTTTFDIGAASSDRYVIVAFTGTRNTGDVRVDSITCAGVSLTEISETGTTGSVVYSAFYTGYVSSGSGSQTFVVDIDGTNNVRNFIMTVWVVRQASLSTKIHLTKVGSGDASVTFNPEASSALCISGVISNNNTIGLTHDAGSGTFTVRDSISTATGTNFACIHGDIEEPSGSTTITCTGGSIDDSMIHVLEVYA